MLPSIFSRLGISALVVKNRKAMLEDQTYFLYQKCTFSSLLQALSTLDYFEVPFTRHLLHLKYDREYDLDLNLFSNGRLLFQYSLRICILPLLHKLLVIARIPLKHSLGVELTVSDSKLLRDYIKCR